MSFHQHFLRPRVASGTITAGIEVDMPRWREHSSIPVQWKLECQTKNKDVSFITKQVQTDAVTLIMGRGKMKSTSYPNLRDIWKEDSSCQISYAISLIFYHLLQSFCSVSRGWVGLHLCEKAQLGVKGFVKWCTTGSSALQVVLLFPLANRQRFRKFQWCSFRHFWGVFSNPFSNPKILSRCTLVYWFSKKTWWLQPWKPPQTPLDQ